MLLRAIWVLKVPRESPDPLDHLVLAESPVLVDRKETRLLITCSRVLELPSICPMAVFSIVTMCLKPRSSGKD